MGRLRRDRLVPGAGSIPSGWENQRLALRFPVGPRDDGESTAETMLHVNGLEIQGIDVWHEEAWLPPELLQEGGIIMH